MVSERLTPEEFEEYRKVWAHTLPRLFAHIDAIEEERVETLAQEVVRQTMELQAENARLREVLERIADPAVIRPENAIVMVRAYESIARETLEGT